MLYLSQVLGRPILDLDGERVAALKDVIVRLGEEDHPPVSGFMARYRRRNFFLPRWRIGHFGEDGVRLNSDILDLRPFMRRDGEVLLARDVLDKQLIDVDGKRVVRVNDVQIIEAANDWRVTGADVSLTGLWRRLAPSFMRSGRAVEVIDWADVGYLATDAATVQLKSSRGKLARLHPVEIARLAEALSYQHGAEIVESLDDETAAETLEEMAAARQAQILGDMDEERAADILEHIGVDVDEVSRAIFEPENAPAQLSYKEVLKMLGRKGDLTSKVRESLVSIGRLLLFLENEAEGMRWNKDIRAHLQSMRRDTASLSDHATYLAGKITFLLDAMLGVVNIEQKAIIKIFSIAAVIFMPPTLVASIYGMNFHRNMIELDWEFGYPFALVLMVVAAVVPILFFRWKKWL
jgi:sporulation protein YlmC with PRC-barrel domain